MNQFHLTAFSLATSALTLAPLPLSATLTALALVAAAPSNANTLLWYRFGGEGATIENVANPGVMDGTRKSIDAWGSSYRLGDTTDNLPVRTDVFTNDVRVIDPKTDAIYPRGRALSWTGDKNHTGAVVVPATDLSSDLKSLKSFTIEAFFKVSQSAIDRATGGGNAMFPIVYWGNDSSNTSTGEGLIFSIYYNNGEFQPFCRFYYCDQNDTTKIPTLSANWDIDSISLDVWHHIAIVADESTSKLTAFLDWNKVGDTSLPDFHGIRYDSANGRPLVIGANPYNTGRVFLGELAEVRITDSVLTKSEFLRPVPPGPVDADTLVYLPLGDTTWFAHSVPLATGIWNAPLNGAPTAAWNPIGWYMSPVSGNYSCGIPALADVAHGSVVRGGCLDTNALADVKSITFSAETALVNSGNLGHIIQFPKDGLAELYAGDFTFEWFFKTDYQSNQAMIVNPWTKVMINGGKVHPRVGNFNMGSGTGSAVVNDGKWHHCALVYRHGDNTFECWVDYMLDQIRLADALATNTQGFFFGGQGYNAQVFNGQLDDLRITKRALAPHEFLTTVPVVANASTTDILHATLEDSLASGQDKFFVSDGVMRIAGTNAKTTATYANIHRDIDYDNDGQADTTSTKALVLDGSNYLIFNTKAVLHTRDFTAEFFAKVTGTGNAAKLIRVAVTSAIGNVSRWDLSPDGTVAALCSSNGVYNLNATTTLSASADPVLSIADGKWHHWAVTASADYSTATTTFKVYCDYVEVAGGTFTDNIIYFGAFDHSLLLGYSGTANDGIVGQFDEIRFRPGVQPVSSFMRWVPRNTVLIFR